MPQHQVAKINRILQDHHSLLQLARILRKALFLRLNMVSDNQPFVVQTIPTQGCIQNIKAIKFMNQATSVAISMNKQLISMVLIHTTVITQVLIMQLLILTIKCSLTSLTTLKYHPTTTIQAIPPWRSKDPRKLDAKRVQKVPEQTLRSIKYPALQ